MMNVKDNILVLDYGSQYTQLIARRVRELKVHSEILPWDAPVETILSRHPKGIILSGGPASATAPGAPTIDGRLLDGSVPVLGICYGMQLLAHVLGGKVRKGASAEYGASVVRVTAAGNPLLRGLPATFQAWMSHWDEVAAVPTGFSVHAESESGAPAAFSGRDGKVLALQFHPEVVHTEGGLDVLRNFLFDVCRCEESWNLSGWVDQMTSEITAKIGGDRVVCGLSGGVDSTVAAVLTSRAVGDRLECIFVNNGLLRKDEARSVLDLYREKLKLKVHYVDASQTFLSRLEGVVEPERKRKIIGETFVRVFEAKAAEIGGAQWLLQGTLYPDVIESGFKGKGASVIKTHHNVGGLPDDIAFGLLEPLRDLFKDEVRAIGALMDVPGAILGRHPFPGPGLAVRCLGEVSPGRLDVLREADAIFAEEIVAAGLYDRMWQAFCVLLPVRTVGVMGDVRTYAEAVVLRAVHSQDGMTADWVRLSPELLDRVSRRICNEVEGVNRVVLDVTSKPPATIEWE